MIKTIIAAKNKPEFALFSLDVELRTYLFRFSESTCFTVKDFILLFLE